VVITCASHAQGLQFELGRKNTKYVAEPGCLLIRVHERLWKGKPIYIDR
jgi:hypothetical protein